MEKPTTLCDRCEKQFSCLLNYDGVPCRKNRTVEPTNYDRIISKTPEEMAAWIADHPVVSEYDENNPQHKACLEWLKTEV